MSHSQNLGTTLLFIPDVVKDKKKYDKNELEPRRLLKDQELEKGGPGVFNTNLRGMAMSTISLSFESADQLCRKLHSCQSRMEDGRHPRDHGRQRTSQTLLIPISRRN